MRRVLPVLPLTLLVANAMAQKIIYANHRTVTGTYQCVAGATARDSAGNFYITGRSEGQVYTEKKSPTGGVIYTHFFSDPPLTTGIPEFIRVNNAGDVFVAGYLSNPVTGYQSGVMVYCISPAGSTVWSIKDATHFDVGGLSLDSTGNPVLGLARQPNSGGFPRNFDLIKYNATSGTAIWKTLQSLDPTLTSCLGLVEGSGRLYALTYINGSSNPYEAASFSETTGKLIWLKPVTPYAAITAVTPRFWSILPSGDFLVCGDGNGYTGGSWGVGMFDRFKATDGSFAFRKEIGAQSGNDNYSIRTTPNTDATGNIYWAGFHYVSSTKTNTAVAGKLSALGVSDFIANLPTGTKGPGTRAEAQPGLNGGEFVATAPNGPVEISALNSLGAASYTKTIASFLDDGLMTRFFVDSAGNPSVNDVSNDLIGNALNRLVTLTGSTGAPKVDAMSPHAGIINNDFEHAAIDSSGNVYVAGIDGLFCAVTKYSPTGTVLWTRILNPTVPAWSGFPAAICWSPRGEIAVATQVTAYDDNEAGLGVAKLNASSGAVNWSVLYGVEQSTHFAKYVAEDLAGNVVVGGFATNATIYSQQGNIVKFGSLNGAFQWERFMPEITTATGFAVDGQGSVFFAGTSPYASSNQYEIRKYNAAGTPTFSHLSSSSNSVGPNALTIDSQGNSYEATFDNGKVTLNRYNMTGVGGVLATYAVPIGTQFDCQLIFDVRHNSLFLMISVRPTFLSYSTVTMRLNPTTGAVIWTDSFARGAMNYAASLGPTWMQWSVDGYGNVVLAGLSALGNTTPSDLQLRKLNYATGKPRYTYTYGGVLASSQDILGGVITDNTGAAVLFGAAPSQYGPGSSQGLITKIADTSAPICYNDSYAVKSNAILSAAVPGPLANDENAKGATVALVTGPTHKSAFSLSTTGAFSYQSAANFKGTDTFTYKATTPYGTSNIATVVITVG